MVDDTQPNRRRNRRFLVSVWLSEPVEGDAAQLVAGRVWEAHPALVGQISDGRKFNRLGDVPGILEELIDTPDLPEAEPSSGTDGRAT